LTYGEDNALRNVTVVGKLTVDSGTGNDHFAVSNMKAESVDINSGSGKDQLLIGPGVVVTSGKVDGGSGGNKILSAVALPAGVKVKSFSGALAAAEGDKIIADVFSELLSLI
jgi:hypothetical protein